MNKEDEKLELAANYVNDYSNKKERSAFNDGYQCGYKNAMAQLSQKNEFVIPDVINWVSVKDKLPKEEKFEMSADVLTIAGDKMSVKCYDYDLHRWTGSPHVTVKYWMELPKPPCL